MRGIIYVMQTKNDGGISMKKKTKRIFLTDAPIVKPFLKYCTVYKSVKKNQQSFRISKSILKNIWNKAENIKKLPQLILTIPANEKENYKITCIIEKEQKV